MTSTIKTAAEIEALGEGTYRNVKTLVAGPHAGHYAHTAAMMHTVGIVVSLNTGQGHVCRWCYANYTEAQRALSAWDGDGDPPGPWLKYKGRGGERRNAP